MNIALIYTENDRWALGMRSISSALKEAGHQTKLILLNTDAPSYSQRILDETEAYIKHTDIIGISSFSRGSDKAKQIINHVKKTFDIMVVWGGVHATLNPEDCAPYADIVCRGEGEEFMIELARFIESGQDWKSIDGGVYKNNGKMTFNNMRPLISNLDKFPPMDYDHADEFHLTTNGIIKADGISDDIEPIMFFGSRGCAFHCNYCSNSQLKSLFKGNGRYVRKLGIQQFINHAKVCREKFPNRKHFYFADEDFFARNIKEIEQFAEEYPRHIGMPFECMASPPQVSQEKMNLFVKAGLWRVDMGVESGSERTKKEIYNRPISNEIVMRAARIINRYPQVVPYYFLIIGNPFEEREDLLETIRFLLELPSPYYLRTYDLVFLPGTKLYDMAIESQIIDGKDESGYELDFLAGLDYKKHHWKKKNLYLNGLLFLMSGKATAMRLGLIPRSLIPVLLHNRMINFNNRHTISIKCMMSIKIFLLSIRSRIAKLVKGLIKDPNAVYNLKSYLGNKFKRRATI